MGDRPVCLIEDLLKRIGFWLQVAELRNPPACTGTMLNRLAADYLAWTAASEAVEPEQALELMRRDQLFKRIDQEAKRLMKPPDWRAAV